jgi:hypothetical protein
MRLKRNQGDAALLATRVGQLESEISAYQLENEILKKKIIAAEKGSAAEE